MIKSNYIVHDCETGGLDPEKNPITQYAAVVLDGKTLKEIDRFETFVKPYAGLEIEQASLNATMVSMSDINNGAKYEDFVKSLKDFWRSHRTSNQKFGRLISVGHNVTFDHSFLYLACGYLGVDIWDYLYENFVDTLVLSKMTFGINGDEKLKLADCCQRAGINLTDAHGAMNDVEATADLFRWFTKKMRHVGGAKSSTVSDEEVERRIQFEFSFHK